MTAPSIKEALEFYADPFAWKKKHDPENVIQVPDFYSETSFGDRAQAALATLQPSGERREAIARTLWLSRGGLARIWDELKGSELDYTRPGTISVFECWRDAGALEVAGLVQDEAGWRDISTAPKDGTEIILGSLEHTYEGQPVAPRVTVGHWANDEECRVYAGDCGGECRCPEYNYVDPSWLSWDGGFTEENPPTHWMPMPAPPIRSARDGGAET